MKSLIFITALAAASFSLAACNNGNKSAASNADKDTSVASTVAIRASSKPGVDPKTSGAVKGLVDNYLQLKNALTKDNGSDAATAGKALADGFAKFDQSALTADQKKSYHDIADDAKENAEHIGMSADKLPHQREHFDMLSKDMYDLVKLFGAGRPLYVDHCPMYNDKKGAIWLSETKEIKNPYMGANMSTCGTEKEELK